MGRLCEKRFGGIRRGVENENDIQESAGGSGGRPVKKKTNRGPISMPASSRTSGTKMRAMYSS